MENLEEKKEETERKKERETERDREKIVRKLVETIPDSRRSEGERLSLRINLQLATFFVLRLFPHNWWLSRNAPSSSSAEDQARRNKHVPVPAGAVAGRLNIGQFYRLPSRTC